MGVAVRNSLARLTACPEWARCPDLGIRGFGIRAVRYGRKRRGAIILGVYVLGWILAIVLIGIPILIGAWIWGLVDGYLSAQRWNLAHGIVS